MCTSRLQARGVCLRSMVPSPHGTGRQRCGFLGGQRRWQVTAGMRAAAAPRSGHLIQTATVAKHRKQRAVSRRMIILWILYCRSLPRSR
jgi:hypothetical protein